MARFVGGVRHQRVGGGDPLGRAHESQPVDVLPHGGEQFAHRRDGAVAVHAGVGGGAMANMLAKAGAKVLVIERGTRLPREADNWSWDMDAVRAHFAVPASAAFVADMRALSA